jgi:hypothetical protein
MIKLEGDPSGGNASGFFQHIGNQTFLEMYFQCKSFGNKKTKILGCAGYVQASEEVLALIRYMAAASSIGNSFGNSTVSEGRVCRGQCWQQNIILRKFWATEYTLPKTVLAIVLYQKRNFC